MVQKNPVKINGKSIEKMKKMDPLKGIIYHLPFIFYHLQKTSFLFEKHRYNAVIPKGRGNK